jgi:tRNA G10  N-methylase Trm11
MSTSGPRGPRPRADRDRPRPADRRGARPRAGDRDRPRPRQALTAQRSGGRTGSGGEASFAVGLERALRAAQEVEAATEGSAASIDALHQFHPYPARMHPATAHALIALLAGARGGRHVLDPFCGSGTTLIEARRMGHRATGVDLNPQAVAIARAKTWLVPKERRKEMRRIGKDLAADAAAEGKAARRAGYEAPAPRPIGPSPTARARALGPWFLPHVRRELEDLLTRIEDVVADDAEAAAILKVPLSAILYKVSLRASETDASQVDKKIARGMATRLYADRIEQLWDGLNALAHRPGAEVAVHEADARELPLPDASVDAIVTSSPYAGTYDYLAQQGLRLDFFGVAASDAGEIGSRGRMAAGGLDDYRRDLAAVLREWVRVLKPGGLAALMIGDSMAGREAVLADRLINEVLPDQLEPVAWAWQERAKLGAAEVRAFGDDAKREHVLLARRAR